MRSFGTIRGAGSDAAGSTAPGISRSRPDSRPGIARSNAGMLALCVLTASLALSGCAGLAPSGGSPAVSAGAAITQPARRFHPAIDLAGRLSLRYDRNGSEQAIDGKFTWNQARDETRITLSTPFGQTLATIDITPAGSVLRQANQPPRSAANVDELTATTLGWPLPLAGLRDWLQGFAVDEHGQPYVATEHATGDAAYVKTADGWLIHYPLWDQANEHGDSGSHGDDSGAHPKRIDLQRQTSQAGKIMLRIVIDQWQPRS